LVLDFSNVTVTGLVYNDSPDNKVTINLTDNSSLTADNEGDGNGQIDVQLPQMTFTVTNILSGSIVEIYDNEVVDNGNNNTLLTSTNSSGTSFSYIHDGTTNDIRVQVIKDGYVERIEDFTLNTTDQSLAMIQKTDTN